MQTQFRIFIDGNCYFRVLYFRYATVDFQSLWMCAPQVCMCVYRRVDGSASLEFLFGLRGQFVKHTMIMGRARIRGAAIEAYMLVCSYTYYIDYIWATSARGQKMSRSDDSQVVVANAAAAAAAPWWMEMFRSFYSEGGGIEDSFARREKKLITFFGKVIC